ncbi:MaoC/PaaZ C-terminal domain-containing protein [Variovorax sp. PAMC 28711]|uniref:MaoC/PaaZ C-terminal domain-containing protein n=1 Tax=Variovorax sp. PAMC 28711 TaxID=1795631 RepID=UPI001439FA5C|nr:MaoC/PaaZ C-terminal domain-containing protein [Variovorax sp. PAMC 28711]
MAISYTQRDVLLYAVGIGCSDLRHVYERQPQFAVFPTFAIRWGGAGLTLDANALPPSPGPLLLDAERHLALLAPLPLEGTVQVRSRLLSVHPRPRNAAFAEVESEVIDGTGQVCVRMVSGSFRRGVAALGDIEPFEGAGIGRSTKIVVPERAHELDLSVPIAVNQAHVYRLSGDDNPLHIAPEAAAFGGFAQPLLHGLCTYGHCGQLLLAALCGGDAARFGSLTLRFSSPVYPGDTLRLVGWHDGAGRLIFEGRVGDKTVVSNASFTYH